MTADDQRYTPDDQLAELLELMAEEAADLRCFVALREAEGPVEEVRDLLLGMLELHHGRAAAILTDCQASHTIVL